MGFLHCLEPNAGDKIVLPCFTTKMVKPFSTAPMDAMEVYMVHDALNISANSVVLDKDDVKSAGL